MAAGWLHFDFWTVLSICMACFRSVLSLVLVAHLIYCSIMRSATPHSGRAPLSLSLSLSVLFLFSSCVEVFAAYRELAIKLTKRTQIAANDCTKADRESTPGGPPAWLELQGVLLANVSI